MSSNRSNDPSVLTADPEGRISSDPAAKIPSDPPIVLSPSSKRSGIQNPIKTLDRATKATTKQLSNATQNTTKHLTSATHNTTKHIGSALKQSEEVYEKSRWCFVARFIGQFPKHFPRVFSLTFGVILPLWILILISAGFGYLLAGYEAPEERVSNHGILASRARLNRTFIKRTDLGRLPVDCIVQYLDQSNRSRLEERIISDVLESSSLDQLGALNATNLTDINITEITDIIDANFTQGTNASDVGSSNATSSSVTANIINLITETEDEILLYMTLCQKEQTAGIETYLEVRDEFGDNSADSMSFNWNRCWSEDIRKVWGPKSFVFLPPPKVIKASHPSQQAAAVETEFVRILNEEENLCLEAGGEEDECFEHGITEASVSAGNICHDNVEATSWFFFTIMTTVGYGNQAPITDEGRLLIYIAGILCLILFAGVLGSSGYIIMSIFDDLVSRFHLSTFLKFPLVGVAMWGGIWIGWAYFIAIDADIWWQERLPDFDVDRDDTLWFAFISTSTIGLGDYFLQPEVMFASDALWFSVAFLIGFVFLSTFLNKVGETIFSVLPQRENSLETRLKETNIFFWKHWPCTDYMRSYMHEDEIEETNEALEKQRELQQQAQRVEALTSHLPNQRLPPPLNTMFGGGGDKTMDNLLEEEEMILKAMLESVEQSRHAIRNPPKESSPIVVTTHLMAGVVPSTSIEFDSPPQRDVEESMSA